MPATPRVAAVGAVAITLLGIAGPVEARGSLECFAEVPGVTVRGVPTTFTYDDGRATSEKRGPDDLGYQPRDVAYAHELGGTANLLGAPEPVTSHWFTLSGDQLREVTEVDRRDRRGLLLAAEYRSRVVRRHWEGVRQISIGQDRNHLYVLTNTDQLLQYRLSGKGGSATVKLAATVGIGFGTIGTLEYARTVTDADGARADVFIATDAETGALVELTIPTDDPTAYSRTVLATEGWDEMRSVGRTASCINARSGRSYDGIVGVDLDGQVLLWTDRDAEDGSGDDIVPRGVLKRDWKPMAYSD
jgi:hypothetical protein